MGMASRNIGGGGAVGALVVFPVAGAAEARGDLGSVGGSVRGEGSDMICCLADNVERVWRGRETLDSRVVMTRMDKAARW